jgi:hypothetical protein
MKPARTSGQNQARGASVGNRPTAATPITSSHSVSSERMNWSCHSETCSATILTTTSWVEKAIMASRISPIEPIPVRAAGARISVMENHRTAHRRRPDRAARPEPVRSGGCTFV